MFGVTEGLAVYLDGTDLPDEVSATEDVNVLIAALHRSLGEAGEMKSWWQGSPGDGVLPLRPPAPS
jgi:hypothetical protein